MRYIANIKLSNGYRMSVLVEGVSNINDAKMAVITNSVVLPEQYQIKKTDDISIEKWVSKSENKTSGRAVYAYYFVKNRELINNGNMNAAGVKTAFNILMPNMANYKTYFIYLVDSRREKEVDIRKRSSVAEAKVQLQDKEKRRRSLGRAIEKSKAAKDSRLVMEVGLIASCIEDYCNGRYKEIPVGTIIGLMAALIYFLSPIDFIPDVVPGAGQIDDVAVIGFALKIAHDDLLQYEEWRKKNKTV